MEGVTRACALAADVETALLDSKLENCERLKRCVSSISPLLNKLQDMRKPFRSDTVQAVLKLQEALETVHEVVENCTANQLHAQMVVLRQLWQRQIELHLAVQFQRVLETDLERSVRTVWGSMSPRP
ncbi:hypothetical protein BSKO_06069 [Bryopsis sp. KO-2023]|nr:hypothetical protein BSKO_06069 [Bryopsis sp. KO-2023]